MRKTATILAAMLLAACNPTKPVGPREALMGRLAAAVDEGTVFYGHQDDLSYGHSWKVEDWESDPLDRSDVMDVTGKYPMVLGMDLGGIEFGDEENLDGVPFGLIRKAALKHIERGGIVTFSWHLRNPLTGGDAWDVSSTEVVRSVLPGGSLHEDFLVWLDRAADFMESLGEVPVIFRPWHENIGSWFWWGGRLCSEEEYKALYRLTWSRLTVDRGLRNIIWCYSPNGPVTPEEYMSRYPGDDVVDILGTDYYERIGDETLDEASKRFSGQMKEMLGTLTGLSTEHGKLMCLSETGLEGQVDPRWWSDALYPALHGSPVCYVLTWRNAHDRPGHFYAPWKGSGNEEDFKRFTEKNDIVLI